MRPFLKWAGGKYRVRTHINQLLPRGERLVEPFVGSGAVFLNAPHRTFYLTDVNRDLIQLYQTLQEEGESFIHEASVLFSEKSNTSEVYYSRREEFNTITESRRKSALFLYLNRYSYNGLCRYNSKGAFNTPFGRYKQPYFPYKEMMYFHKKSQHAVFACCDFRDTYSKVRTGDVVYCDPPYAPIAEQSFVAYAKGGFGEEDHRSLALLAEEKAREGIPTLLSNHDTPFTREIYRGATLTHHDVFHKIGAKGASRGVIKECFAFFDASRGTEK